MSGKTKQETYHVEGAIGVCVGLDIQAKSLEEAFEKSKGLKLQDFIDILGSHNDSNFKISGVFSSGSAPAV